MSELKQKEKYIQQQFELLKGAVEGKELIYLDSAATTLKPNRVVDRLSHFYRYEASNVHRGVHYLSGQATTAYEGARHTVKEFISANSETEIIFTKGTTESINLVAHSLASFLESGDEIILSEMEHHSNILPWQVVAAQKGVQLKFIPVNEQGELIWEEYLKRLSSRTRLVALSHCSNTLGTFNPIEKYIAAARQAGAWTLVDAAQSVSKRPVDVQKLDCDFLAFSGHKVFAPFGIGVLYGKSRWLGEWSPYQTGGGIVDKVDYQTSTYLDSPFRFEAGTPPVAEAIALAEALEFVKEIGFPYIESKDQEIVKEVSSLLKEVPGLRLIGEATDRVANFSFVIDGIHANDIGVLLDEQGIAVRTGHHCTQLLMKRFHVPATVRASFGIYNTVEQGKKLQQALFKVKEIFDE